MEKKVPIYLEANHTNSHVEISIEKVLSIIKSGKDFGLVDKTQRLRKAVIDGDLTGKDSIKKKLPSFITAGLCKGTRSAANFDPESYTGLVILDIDKIDDQGKDKEEVLEKAKSIDYTFAAFTSPSGKGIKIIVKIDTTSEHHKVAYGQVQRHYQNKLGVLVDEASDIVRLCFMCYDPDLYQNKNSRVFIIQPVMEIKDIIDFTNKKSRFDPGNRNNYTFLLACNLNRAGINENSAAEAIISQFSEPGFSEGEIQKIVKSAYSNTAEHGKYKYENSFGEKEGGVSAEDHNLFLSEMQRNKIEPNEAIMARLAIWALKEKNDPIINSLREEATLIEGAINDCSDGKLLKYICAQYEEIDCDDIVEHEDEEIRNCFNAHQPLIRGYNSLPTELLIVAIVYFKLVKLTEAYNKLIHQAFFVPRVKAGTYHERLSKMVKMNNTWKSSYDALVLNYLERHRS